MSEFDTDIESMLSDILEGKDPQLDALDTPPPLEDEELLSADPEEDAIPSIADILGTPEPEPEAEPEPELHACKTEESVPETPDVSTESTDEALAEAELEPVDESQWSKEVEVESIQLPEFTSDELMEDLDIRNYGTLVSLNTLRWHAKVRDHKAAADAAATSGADKAAFEARKRLLVGADEKLKRVHTAIDAARTEHYRMTLPWSTVGVNDHGKRAGPRLLPNTLFFEYTKKMGKYNQDMKDALDEFVAAYPTLIAVAQKKLGSSFDVTQYPQPSSIRNYFGLSFDFLPIPVGADFDNVTLQQAEKLAMNVNKKTKQMLENAMQDAWKRLLDDVTHAYSALKNPNAKFHYTLIDKLKEHASMLSHLNVTNDKRIEDIRNRIDKKLTRYDVKDIRKDDGLRASIAKSCKKILKLMKEITDDSQGKTNGN